MEITGPGGIGGPPKINPDRKPVRVPPRQGGSAGGDKVEILGTNLGTLVGLPLLATSLVLGSWIVVRSLR